MTVKKSNLGDLHILLGVSGSIAVYRAVDLASKLTASGSRVKTVMTANACQLVRPKSFEAVTGSAVYTDLWRSSEEYEISHISLVKWADIVVVAPATANIIGKVANGICDDLLSTILCVCWSKPGLLVPAMNDEMWHNPAVQRNVETAKQMGFEFKGPEKGRLACGEDGFGRMSQPQEVLEAIKRVATRIKRQKRKK